MARLNIDEMERLVKEMEEREREYEEMKEAYLDYCLEHEDAGDRDDNK